MRLQHGALWNLTRISCQDTALEGVVKVLPPVVCRLLECGRFSHLIKGQVKTHSELEELERSTEAAIVAALHGELYEKVLRKNPALQNNSAAWDGYLRTLRPQPIGQAAKAAEKAEAPTRYNPPSGTEESQPASSNKAQDPASTSAFIAGQAAPLS